STMPSMMSVVITGRRMKTSVIFIECPNILCYPENVIRNRHRIVQCKMILKSSSFPMQDDPEIGILPCGQLDANSDEEYRGASAGAGWMRMPRTKPAMPA